MNHHFRSNKAILPQKRPMPDTIDPKSADVIHKTAKPGLTGRIASLKAKLSSTATTRQSVDTNPELRARVDDILSKTPARERYQDLISSPLPLPTRYNALLRVFECLDAALRFNSYRKDTTLFDEVRHTIATTRSLRVTTSHLQQIVHVWPEAYTIRWTE